MARSRTPSGVPESGAASSRSYWSGEMVSGGGECCREACRLEASSGRPTWRTSWRRALHSCRSDAGDNPRPPWPPAVVRWAIQRARTSPLRSCRVGGRPSSSASQARNRRWTAAYCAWGSVASAWAVPCRALDAPLLEGLDVAVDGAAANREPLREGGVGDPGFVLPGLAMASRRSAGLAGWLGRARPGALSGTPSRSATRASAAAARESPPDARWAVASSPSVCSLARRAPGLALICRYMAHAWLSSTGSQHLSIRDTWRSAVAAAGVYRVAKALESPVRFGCGGLVDQLARVSPETATVGYLRTCSASPAGSTPCCTTTAAGCPPTAPSSVTSPVKAADWARGWRGRSGSMQRPRTCGPGTRSSPMAARRRCCGCWTPPTRRTPAGPPDGQLRPAAGFRSVLTGEDDTRQLQGWLRCPGTGYEAVPTGQAVAVS
jgi:hypothetical protein